MWRPHGVVAKLSDEIASYRKFSNGPMYKLSGTWSEWNRDYFLMYLEDSKDFWDWEVEGSKKVFKMTLE